MHILLQKIYLPLDILNSINEYIGEDKYWDAREKLTLYNTKIDMFSSDWWKDWETYLCWYHWNLKHSHGIYSSRNINDLINISKIPSRFSWLYTRNDKEVSLILKLYKASVFNHNLLRMLNLKLSIMYQYWQSHVRYYRKIVFY